MAYWEEKFLFVLDSHCLILLNRFRARLCSGTRRGGVGLIIDALFTHTSQCASERIGDAQVRPLPVHGPFSVEVHMQVIYGCA